MKEVAYSVERAFANENRYANNLSKSAVMQVVVPCTATGFGKISTNRWSISERSLIFLYWKTFKITDRSFLVFCTPFSMPVDYDCDTS